MAQNYYLGLDMGTSSLGWAVTDPEYHLLRAKGKDLWGVRLFQEAESAAGRRTQRVSRRRLQREKARIGFVKEVFSDAISAVDPGFYQRLDDSKYFPEDKTEEQRFALFAGDGFTDKEYYEKYPTIFHLRSDLLHSTEPKDVRLVYLAILNIFKHRGHFLNANLSDGKTEGLEDIYMSWRTIIISNTAKLDYQLGFMVVRGKETVRVHINEIEMLVIESTAVSFTAYLMNELIKNKVKVIFCDEKRNPSSELLPYYGAHDTSAKIRHQMAWTEENKASVWTEIVTEKIRKQAEHLYDLKRPEAGLLYQYIEELSFGDETNREGHAAKVYFNALFGKDFTRTEDTPLNAALNYGYSIILSQLISMLKRFRTNCIMS